nr:hypothetical transcript [Hymenolepis microstoma]
MLFAGHGFREIQHADLIKVSENFLNQCFENFANIHGGCVFSLLPVKYQSNVNVSVVRVRLITYPSLLAFRSLSYLFTLRFERTPRSPTCFEYSILDFQRIPELLNLDPSRPNFRASMSFEKLPFGEPTNTRRQLWLVILIRRIKTIAARPTSHPSLCRFLIFPARHTVPYY